MSPVWLAALLTLTALALTACGSGSAYPSAGPTTAPDVVDCAQPHRVVEARSRDFCSKSVGAWLDYPVDYDFGYSWFHQPEWSAGNRRSVCWARTDR
jgi:hypothetical protein